MKKLILLTMILLSGCSKTVILNAPGVKIFDTPSECLKIVDK